jgi:hypothetical protein
MCKMWKALTFSMALSTILQKRNDCFTLWIYDYGIRLQAYQQYDIWPMQASGWIQARPNQENTRQWLTAVFLSRRSPFTRLACLRCFRSIHSNIIYWQQKNSLRDNNETHETTTVAAIAVRSPDANPLNMVLLPGDQCLVWCYKRWFRIIQGWDIWLWVWCIRCFYPPVDLPQLDFCSSYFAMSWHVSSVKMEHEFWCFQCIWQVLIWHYNSSDWCSETTWAETNERRKNANPNPKGKKSAPNYCKSLLYS